MAVNGLTGANFDDEVLKSEKPVLVDFFADWCGPCKMTAPVVEELSNEHPEYKFCKVNVDSESELASRYGVMSIPTLIVFKDGKAASQSVGAISKEAMLALFK
ncbi:MAG: thioredoxin [Treponema sp.]|nr:thioredoxin [Treponema sp.]MDE6245205.1 thioredoxin [Treponemataceae bacterium]MBD5404393.1 thioredoxin [Treponema sp.]MBD5406977.1 thioredoxin [Treponema sp.]MBD5409378.1 thioredoxin [Treponema sp.]